MIPTVEIGDKTFVIKYNRSDINSGLYSMAENIKSRFIDKNPLFIIVMDGAFMFASGILSRLRFPCEIMSVKMKSYEGTSSTGNIKECDTDLSVVKGRHVIIIEDIVDTGMTMKRLREKILDAGCTSFDIICAVNKVNKHDIPIYKSLFEMEEDEFIVGYGLDYNGIGRNIPEIYVEKE